jgi:molybdate transport system permease protein
MRRRRVSGGTAIVAVIAGSLIVLPVGALLTRVPWSQLVATLAAPDSLAALRLSAWTSITAAGLSVVLGVPLAWALARGPQRVMSRVRPLVTMPLVLPPTVAGLAMLALLGRNGLLGAPIYSATGWALPFTAAAVVVAGVFVGMPFFVLVVESGFAALPRELEDAAETEGASPGQILRTIALPQARHAVLTGAVLAWARALGEFGATLTFAGSMPGLTRTMPMQVYTAMDVDLGQAYALSLILVMVSVAVLWLLRGAVGRALISR